MRMFIRAAITAAWTILAVNPVSVRAANCDRACLEELIDNYLNALVDHDPTSLPTSSCVTYVENSQFLPLGTGEWKAASKLGKYRHTFADPEAQQVGAITTLHENGVGIIYIVRLRLDKDGKITEIESQITRDPVGAERYENMTTPEAVWLEAVPQEERISRAQLIAQTDRYYTGMERNDPKGNYSFFHKDCNRLEDGLKTTNQKNGDPYGHSNDTSFASLGCEAQFQTGFLGFVTKIRDRRYPVVDEERQAVLAITIFDHNGTVRSLPSINGTSSPIPPYFDVPRTLAASEGFRLKGDKLFRIEMTLTEVPYGMRTAFDAGEPLKDLRSIGNRLTSTNVCDRLCLSNHLDQVIDGLLSNNTSKLPLAKGARYSENGQFLAFGDGLWETLQQAEKPDVGEYAQRFIDPTTGTAAYWGLVKEQVTPGMLALRVKISSGKITEIEAIAVRAESEGARGGTLTLMRPPLPVEWEGASLGKLDPVFSKNATGNTLNISSVVDSYFNSIQQHKIAGVSFSSVCKRRNNGRFGRTACIVQTEGKGVAPNGLFNGTTSVRDRRVLVVDSARGVALAVVMVDYPATGAGPSPETESVPSTYMVPHLIKVESRTIRFIESFIKWMPFGYTSAWTEENGNRGGYGGAQRGANCSFVEARHQGANPP